MVQLLESIIKIDPKAENLVITQFFLRSIAVSNKGLVITFTVSCYLVCERTTPFQISMILYSIINLYYYLGRFDRSRYHPPYRKLLKQFALANFLSSYFSPIELGNQAQPLISRGRNT